jgi:hypothetical protein
VTLPPAPNFASPTRAGSQAAAKAAIETDGYRQVSDLAQGSDGTWYGKAMRGNTQVSVRVDARGNVSAE